MTCKRDRGEGQRKERGDQGEEVRDKEIRREGGKV
jgi:hypothetical protein